MSSIGVIAHDIAHDPEKWDRFSEKDHAPEVGTGCPAAAFDGGANARAVDRPMSNVNGTRF
jgi:hypothetical protein